MNAYLILRDIRPAHNRYRVYEIRIGSVRMQGQEHYSVVLAWGRVGHQKRRQVFLLDSLEKEFAAADPLPSQQLSLFAF